MPSSCVRLIEDPVVPGNVIVDTTSAISHPPWSVVARLLHTSRCAGDDCLRRSPVAPNTPCRRLKKGSQALGFCLYPQRPEEAPYLGRWPGNTRMNAWLPGFVRSREQEHDKPRGSRGDAESRHETEKRNSRGVNLGKRRSAGQTRHHQHRLARQENRLADPCKSASLSSNSKCNTTGPAGRRCCHAHKILSTPECRRT